ncbi:MAG: LysR family transcriptional regulator [Alicyclobacillus sp.]|nr:LysR family transcriptional regulator [Alicyclobacillus sp.]
MADRLYRTLVQVVESATLVEAAAVLHLTQPTVSRQLQQLESDLGQPLFDRIGGRLVLTRAGELTYEMAKRLIALEEKLREDLASLANPEGGTVHLGAGLTPAIYLLPPVLAAYRRAHPRVTFQLRTGSSGDLLAALRQREVDVCIVTTMPDDTDHLSITPLYRDDLLLVAPPNHPLALRPGVTAAALVDQPFILMPPTSGLRRLAEEILARPGHGVTAALEADSLESINRLVQAGVGLSFLPRSCVQDDLTAGRLRVLHLMDDPPRSRTISAVCRRDLSMTAAARRFADELPSWFQKLYRSVDRL